MSVASPTLPSLSAASQHSAAVVALDALVDRTLGGRSALALVVKAQDALFATLQSAGFEVLQTAGPEVERKRLLPAGAGALVFACRLRDPLSNDEFVGRTWLLGNHVSTSQSSTLGPHTLQQTVTQAPNDADPDWAFETPRATRALLHWDLLAQASSTEETLQIHEAQLAACMAGLETSFFDEHARHLLAALQSEVGP